MPKALPMQLPMRVSGKATTGSGGTFTPSSLARGGDSGGQVQLAAGAGSALGERSAYAHRSIELLPAERDRAENATRARVE